MKKRLLSLLLVAGMLIGLLSVGIAEEYAFSDDDGTGTWTWASDYIYDCYEAGIINGYEDGTFLPSQNVTRAEMAKMIAVAYGLVSDAEESNFSDVGTHWALQYIEACADAGIITGYQDETFLPGNNITRAEAATILSRTLDLLNADEDSDDDGSSDTDSGYGDTGDSDTSSSDTSSDDSGELHLMAGQSTTTTVIRYNVSTSAVSCNATAGSLPTSKTSLTGGSSYYFNLQVSSNLKIAKAALYVKDVGESSYTRVHLETAKSYFRYVYYKYTVNNKTGTLYYYWKLTYTDGTTESTDKTSVTVTKSSTTFPTSLYLTMESGSTKCTIYSATMMIRARFYLSGSSYWKNIQAYSKGTTNKKYVVSAQ